MKKDENVNSYFYCILGSCEECRKNDITFGCEKRGDCQYCTARYSDFCRICKYRSKDD